MCFLFLLSASGQVGSVRGVRPGTQHAIVDGVQRCRLVRHGQVNLVVADAHEQGRGGSGAGPTVGGDSAAGSSDDQPTPRRTMSAAVAHNPPTAGIVQILTGTGT